MKSNKLLLNLLVSLITTGFISSDGQAGTVDSDGSFQTFCSNVRGTYTKRNSGLSENGDLCKVSYPIKTKDNVEAKRFCKVALPYKLHESVSGDSTTSCTAESLIVCPFGYQQIDGKCFMLVDDHEHYTYDEAVKVCEARNAKLAHLSRTKTSAYWTYYWPQLSMVWVDVTDDIASHTILKEGNNYAVLFSMAIFFRKRRHSLVKIDGKNHRGMVICEKEHRKTGACKRTYGEELEHREVCEKVAKPFAYKNEREYFPADLSDIKSLFGKNLIVARSALTIRENVNVRNTQTCSNIEQNKRLDYIFKKQYKVRYDEKIKPAYYDPCDAQWSMAYIKVNETMDGKRASDAMRAPFLCQTHVSFMRYDSCSSGESLYMRENGDAVCHKSFRTKLTWDDAQNYCQTEYGGYLSGFTSDEEKLLLNVVSSDHAWIGGKRKLECLWDRPRNGRGWEDVGQCTKPKVFHWLENVAPNDKSSILHNHWRYNEPNLLYGSENCLQIAYYDDARSLNDLTCSVKLQFICQKPATVSYISN